MGENITCGEFHHGLKIAAMKQQHPLRHWRNSQVPSVTLSALAEKLSVTPSHLSEIENFNNVPSLKLAVELSRITSIDVKQFVAGAAVA